MGKFTFLKLVILWPVALTFVAWLLTMDIGLFSEDTNRASKTAWLLATIGAVTASFGFRDWWLVTMPEVEPEPEEAFLSQTRLLYSAVIAMSVAAYVATWLVEKGKMRLLPSAVALIAFTGVRTIITTERRVGPSARDVVQSASTRIPDALKNQRDDRG